MYIYAMSKLSRHSAIRDLVSSQDVTSQEELRRRLYRRGHRVTVFSQSGPGPDALYNVVVVPSGRRLRRSGNGLPPSRTP